VAVFCGGLVDHGLPGGLLPLVDGAQARALERLQLGAVSIDIKGRVTRNAIREALFDQLDLGGREVECRQVAAHQNAQRIERLVVLAGGYGGGCCRLGAFGGSGREASLRCGKRHGCSHQRDDGCRRASGGLDFIAHRADLLES
jgi:hypothetical protein